MPEADEKCECCGDTFQTGENPSTKGSLLVTAETCASLGGSCTSNIDTCVMGGGVARVTPDCPNAFCCVRSSTVILDVTRDHRVLESQTFKDRMIVNVLQLTQIRRAVGTWRKGGTAGRSRLCYYIDGAFRECETQCVAVGEVGVVNLVNTMAGREITFRAQDEGCGSQLQSWLDQLDVLLTLAVAEADVTITRRGTTETMTGKTTKFGDVFLSLLVAGATYDFRATIVLGGVAGLATGSFVAPAAGTKITVETKMVVDPSGGGGPPPPPDEEKSFLEEWGLWIAAGALGAVAVGVAATRKRKRA